jgi:hypothetical protein
MLAAIPPRWIARSSARNDKDNLSNWSTTSESENRPLNVIRWSVAIDPVTAMFTVAECMARCRRWKNDQVTDPALGRPDPVT